MMSIAPRRLVEAELAEQDPNGGEREEHDEKNARDVCDGLRQEPDDRGRCPPEEAEDDHEDEQVDEEGDESEHGLSVREGGMRVQRERGRSEHLRSMATFREINVDRPPDKNKGTTNRHGANSPANSDVASNRNLP